VNVSAQVSSSELLEFLVDLFPAFRRQWDDEENNMNRNGDDFTAHGVCAEFSSFYVLHCAAADPAIVSRLFAKIEELVVGDPTDQDPVANAICTCFLENIAQLPAGEMSVRFMGPETRTFFAHWHVER
jgi:hypothetical protein